MDTDLSHAAVQRFESIEERLRVLEEGGSSSSPEETEVTETVEETDEEERAS